MARRRKNKGSSGETILLLGGLGIGAYLLWNWLTTPTTATATPSVPQTPTMPQALPAGTSSISAATQPATATAGPSLDSLYASLIQVATQNAPKTGVGPNQIQLLSGQPQMTFSAWNYYLAQVDPSLTNLPTYQTVAGSPDPNTAISGPVYWGLMSPWLSANKGLSGLGFYGGLGAYLIARGRM
jgi:hypothetical protein